MKIKICEENKNEILRVLKKEEGRSKVRTINYDDVVDFSNYAESLLKQSKINQKDRIGFEYEYATNDTAKAYKSVVKSTYIKLYRGSNKHWFLIDVERKSLFAGDASIDNLRYKKQYALGLIVDTINDAKSEKKGYIQNINRIIKNIIIPENDTLFEDTLKREINLIINLIENTSININSKNYHICIEKYPEYFI